MISIIDNFVVNVAKPIDSRLVATLSSDLTNIDYKYAGLKVYVTDEALTYVYGTDSIWRVDSGGNSNIGGGIYGGSGSLPEDVTVFIGTVSETVNDRSYYLNFKTDGLEGDKSIIYNYSYRKSTGSEWQGIAYRQEKKSVLSDNSVEQGPFIEYNGINYSNSELVGSLNLGVATVDGLSRVTRVSITDLATEFYSGQDPITNTEYPFSILKVNEDTTLGYNTKEADDYYEYTQPSYRMRFGDGGTNLSEWKFDLRKPNSESWNTLMRLDAELEPNTVSSNVRLFVDSSSRDWDSISNRTPQLLTPQEIVRNIEHKYTKTQMLGFGTFYSLSNEILVLNSNGNSFKVILSANQSLKDIKCFKAVNVTPDFPAGTILNIKFVNKESTPGFISLYDGSNDSKIVSEIHDKSLGIDSQNRRRLTIYHSTITSENGDQITFKRTTEGYWEIISVDRSSFIVNRDWTVTGGGKWSFLSTPQYWRYSQDLIQSSGVNNSGSYVSLTTTSINYNFITNRANNIYTLNYAPNRYSSTNENRFLLYSEGFKFRIAKDGNRTACVQGNFVISINGAKVLGVDGVVQPNSATFYYYNHTTAAYAGRENFFKIGQITEEFLKPSWEATYTMASGYGYVAPGGLNGTTKYAILLENVQFSINRIGEIFVSFRANLTTSLQLQFGKQTDLILVEIRVPSFSYITSNETFVDLNKIGGTTIPNPDVPGGGGGGGVVIGGGGGGGGIGG